MGRGVGEGVRPVELTLVEAAYTSEGLSQETARLESTVHFLGLLGTWTVAEPIARHTDCLVCALNFTMNAASLCLHGTMSPHLLPTPFAPSTLASSLQV